MNDYYFQKLKLENALKIIKWRGGTAEEALKDAEGLIQMEEQARRYNEHQK